MLVSRDRLAAACRGADRSAVTDLVAALYEARGYAVEQPADGRLVLQPDGQTVAVCPPDPSEVPRGTDVLVTVDGETATAAGTAPDIVDADTLHRQLHYAVDRDVARDLLGKHLDVEVGDDRSDGQGSPVDSGPAEDGVPDTPTPDASTEGPSRDERNVGDDTSHDPRSWRRSRLTVVVAAAGMVLLVGLLAGGIPTLSSDIGGPEDIASTGTPSPPSTGTSTPSGDRNGAAIPAGESNVDGTPHHSMGVAFSQLTRDHPPGIGAGGLADIDTLIATHRGVLSNTSFTVTVRYREFEDGRVTGAVVETVRVESTEQYSVSISKTGILETRPRALVGADAFSNGNRTWVRPGSSETYLRSQLSTSRILGQLARYLRWSLSVEASTLHGQPSDETGTYWIRTDGDPYQGIRDASGTVYVTGQGVVTYGRWTYTTIRPETRVEFSVWTSDIGTTTVSRPGWVEDGAANETGTG